MAEDTFLNPKPQVSGKDRRVATLAKRLTDLEAFKKTVDEFIEAEKQRLEVERSFLQLAQKSQGLDFVMRRSVNMNAIKSLAVVTQVKLGDFLSDKGFE